MAALRPLGELVEKQWVLQEFHLALDRALRWPLVLVVHSLGGRHVIIQYGGGGRSSPSKSYRISFFIISQFLCH